MHKTLLASFFVFALLLQLSPAQEPGKGRGPVARPLPGVPVEAVKPAEPDWAQSEIVFYGKLNEVQAGPVAKSLPPIYNHTLTFTIERVLRGDLSTDGDFTGNHSARQMEEPKFPKGENCLVAVTAVRGSFRITAVKKADADDMKKMATMLSLPLGWTAGADGKVQSPWTADSVAEGTKFPEAGEAKTCSISGRPALSAGNAQITLSPVPPAKSIKWTNPDGDGEYEIVVSNPTDQEIQVPALLTDGETIFWDQCLLIICQKKPYAIPGAKPLTGELKSVTLAPNQRISTVVNALSLNGPQWPRGGYRIEFQFCLGEKSVRHSFYYMSRHHDAIRDKAQKK